MKEREKYISLHIFLSIPHDFFSLPHIGRFSCYYMYFKNINLLLALNQETFFLL